MEKKILLKEEDLPKYWYNILPDLPTPIKPPLNPETKKPLTAEDLKNISRSRDRAGNE